MDLPTTLRAIRGECKRQAVDDDARRALMFRLAGVGSSTALDLAGARRVLAHLRRSGGPAPATNEWAFVFAAIPERQPLLKKIYRLAQAIGGGKPVSKAYVESVASRMAGSETRLEFCDTERLHKVVQALEVHQRRQGK